MFSGPHSKQIWVREIVWVSRGHLLNPKNSSKSSLKRKYWVFDSENLFREHEQFSVTTVSSILGATIKQTMLNRYELLTES